VGSLGIILNRRSAGIMLAVSSGVLFLSACVLPPSVQIASWVADGVSYIITQKSLTDHGISFITQRDCALWRGIKGEAICRDPGGGTVAVAANDGEEVALAGFETAAGGPPRDGGKTPEGIFTAAKNAGEPFAVPVRAAPWATAVVARQRGFLRKVPPVEPTAQSGLFYVIGSFRRLDFAQALVQRQGALNARLVDVSVGGSRLYRVVVGPFDQGRQYYVYRRIAEAGIDGAWATLMTLPTIRRGTVAQAPANGRRGIRRAGVAGAWLIYLEPGKWNIAESRGAKTGRRLSEAPLFHGAG
jgi:hypothetical protein